MEKTMYEQSKEMEQFIIDFRHDLHQNPELSLKEFRTTNQVIKELEKMGLSYTRFEPSGVMTEIKGTQEGGCVGLRADIDALPIQEKTGLCYASQVENVMHACGHDTHCAMLLGAVKLLDKNRDKIKGSVRCIFQPAEEIAAGAKLAIAQGAAKNVQMFFALHACPGIEAGTLCYCPGNALAASATFEIEVHGVAAHGATPECSIDAALAASQIVNNLQTIVSRRIGAMDSCVISVGTINCGTLPNIIPDYAKITGTCRFLNSDFEEKIIKWMKEIAENTAAVYGATATVNFCKDTDVVVNSPEALDVFWKSAGKLVDVEKTKKQMPPIMASEDFGVYSLTAPAAFVFLGMGGNGPGHNEKFQLEDTALTLGSALYAQFAIDALENLKEK